MCIQPPFIWSLIWPYSLFEADAPAKGGKRSDNEARIPFTYTRIHDQGLGRHRPFNSSGSWAELTMRLSMLGNQLSEFNERCNANISIVTSVLCLWRGTQIGVRKCKIQVDGQYHNTYHATHSHVIYRTNIYISNKTGEPENVGMFAISM